MRTARVREAVRDWSARLVARLPERRWQRVAVAIAAVAVIVGIGIGVAGARRDHDVEATVHAFFEARRDGDCERLIGLVSEASWSQGGRLDRDEFVESCDQVVDHYGPDLGDVEVVADDGERAVVTVSVPLEPGAAILPGQADGLVVHEWPSDGDRSYATGTLVREGDGWKIETDQALLRIGRSPKDTLRSYLQARADGNCEEVADLLTEAAWSADGAQNRDEFVERCTETTAPDPTLQPVGLPTRFEISERGGQVTAVAETPVGPELAAETITLVQDGITWELDHDTEAVTYRQLRALVLDPPAEGYEADLETAVRPGVSGSPLVFDAYEGSDSAEQRLEAGFERGAIVRFAHGDDYITVLLYQFDETAGARAYAEHLADRMSVQADPRAPRAPVGATFSMVTGCGEGPDCSHADETLALTIHDRYLAAVQAVDYVDDDPTADQLLSRARQILQAQIDRL